MIELYLFYLVVIPISTFENHFLYFPFIVFIIFKKSICCFFFRETNLKNNPNMPSRTTKSKPRSLTRARGTKKEKRTTKSRKTEKLRVSSRRPSRRSKRSSRSTYKGRFDDACINTLENKYKNVGGLNIDTFKENSFLTITGAKKESSLIARTRNVYVVKVSKFKYHVIWTSPERQTQCLGLVAISANEINAFISDGFLNFDPPSGFIMMDDVDDEIHEKMFDFSKARFKINPDLLDEEEGAHIKSLIPPGRLVDESALTSS